MRLKCLKNMLTIMNCRAVNVKRVFYIFFVVTMLTGKAECKVLTETDSIDRIIILATDPRIMTPVDETRLSFLNAWQFDGMHHVTVGDKKEIHEIVGMLDHLHYIDSVDYNQNETGLKIRYITDKLVVYMQPGSGPVALMLVCRKGDSSVRDLIWISGSDTIIGKRRYKTDSELWNLVRTVGLDDTNRAKSIKELQL